MKQVGRTLSLSIPASGELTVPLGFNVIDYCIERIGVSEIEIEPSVDEQTWAWDPAEIQSNKPGVWLKWPGITGLVIREKTGLAATVNIKAYE